MTENRNNPLNLYGATPDEWRRFAALMLPDLRPIASNPTLKIRRKVRTTETDQTGAETVTERASLIEAGDRYLKMPSIIGANGPYGMRGWQSYNATNDDVTRWRANADHGFGFVPRLVKGIDIDVDDPALADRIDNFFCAWFDADLPVRRRPNSSRRMLIYRLKRPEQGRSKFSVALPPDLLSPSGPVSTSHTAGAVEFLFDNSFIMAAGMHKSGVRVAWEALPDSYEDIPVIDNDKVLELINAFMAEFGIRTEPYQSRFTRRPDASGSSDAPQTTDLNDPIYQYIVNSDWFKGSYNSQGMLCVRCPWEDQHSNYGTGGGKADETVYIPRGLGGVSKHGFRCMHETHGPKNFDDFLNAIGYVPQEFDVIENPDALPVIGNGALFDVTRTGVIKATLKNMQRALSNVKYMGYKFAYDEFYDQVILIRHPDPDWRPIRETDYSRIIIELSEKGFAEPEKRRLADVIELIARDNKKNSARDRLTALKWDGTPRLAAFHRDVLKADDTPYTRAVVEYLFTAAVARIMAPGTKADMVPLLIGKEGVRKSTLLARLVLDEDWYGDVSMGMSDADFARHLRGKSIVEFGELRGNTPKAEAMLKARLSRTFDEFVPKFKELSVIKPRTNLFVGTTNYIKSLIGRTGDRRWLPLTVGQSGHIDTDYVERNREQLWAEARELYNDKGVLWQDAARLAMKERHRYAATLSEESRLRTYLASMELTEVTVDQLMTNCFDNKQVSSTIIEQTLLNLGYTETSSGHYTLNLY